MKVLIAVTHLLGTGHLARALTLARAFLSQGHDATVVSGGMPAPHLDRGDVALVQLNPVRSDGVKFSVLLDANGNEVSPTVLASRREHLTSLLKSDPPDVIITELFPFGRRILADEFLTFLRTAHEQSPMPIVCGSVRDILAPPSKPAKAQRTEDIVSRFYDAILVHSDRALVPLEASWPVTARLASYLHYTGFVAPPPTQPLSSDLGKNEIIVSAGGGDVGADVFETALQTARLMPGTFWRLLVGGQNAAETAAELMQSAPINVIAEPARPEFRQMLHRASASISMCGYNTALDILQTGVPAVLVPFDAGAEREQGLRAAALSRLKGISVLSSTDLSPEALRSAIGNVMNAPRRQQLDIDFDGALKTVRIVEDLRGRKR